MKKLLTVLILFCMLAACTTNNKEDYMQKTSFDGKKLAINLDLSAGTGYQWLVVYQTDNLKIDREEYKVFNSDPTATGGSGTKHFECSVSDNKDALLILKCERPGEDSPASYEIFRIWLDDGKISKIIDDSYSMYKDCEFLDTSVDGYGWFSMFVLKDLEHWERADSQTMGFSIGPGMESTVYIGKDSGRATMYDTELVEKISISGEEYNISYHNGDRSRPANIYNFSGHVMTGIGSSKWGLDYFPELIMMFDTHHFEK